MKAPNIDSVYPKLIKSVLKQGKEYEPRGMKVKEIYNVSFKINDARACIITNPYRKFHLPYAIIEMLGLFQNGAYNVEPYTWYCNNMKSFINPETGLWDASYATRLTEHKQLEEMFNILRADPDSRRAVIQIYTPQEDFHNYESKDIACTLSLIFRLREGKLNMTSTIRGNDVMLGVGYDATQYVFLQSVLACWLGVEVGEWSHFAANMHAYERDWGKLKTIATEKWPADFKPRWKKMPEWDVQDIRETFLQIKRFFAMEKEFRSCIAKNIQTDIPILFERYKITSKFLKNAFLDILLPYILKKS